MLTLLTLPYYTYGQVSIQQGRPTIMISNTIHGLGEWELLRIVWHAQWCGLGTRGTLFCNNGFSGPDPVPIISDKNQANTGLDQH